jgi:YVTN family beta-propeller protein
MLQILSLAFVRSRRLLHMTASRLLAFAAAISTAGAQQRTTTGTVLVANQQSASATIIDVATQTATTVDVGTGPHEAVISPDGRWGVVTIYGVGGAPGNKLSVIDLPAKKVVRTIDLGAYVRPHGASFVTGQPNVVAVTSEATQNVVLADIVKGEVLGVVPTQHPGSHMLGVTADGKRAYTANINWGGISEIDLEKRAFVRDLQASSITEGVGVAPDGSTIWLGANQAGTVTVIDGKAWKVVETLTGFGMPYRIGLSPDGSLAVICDPKDNKIHIADVKARKIIGEVASLGSPRGVKIAPDNRTVFVTLGAENAVAAIDLVEKKVLWRAPVGASPDGVWYGPQAR